MFAVYRLPLHDPARLPALEIERLREALPGVEIGADGEALVFMAEDPDLGDKVRSAVHSVYGEGDWTYHFHSLDNDPEAA